MNTSLVGPVVSQANRIAEGNPDLSQDLAAMAYDNHRRCSDRGKELSIGELVNYMKHRSSELRSDIRKPFGAPKSKCANDVFRQKNYLNSQLEVLSMDYVKEPEGPGEDPTDGQGFITAMTATKDMSEAVLLEVGLESFLARFSDWVRGAFILKAAGYTYKEIAHRLGKTPDSIRHHLKNAGRQFIVYFDLPPGYLVRYGLV